MRLTRSITLDTRGDDVFDIQKKLFELGYYNHVINGVFDNNTLFALNSFQKDNMLEISDFVSIKTARLLFNDIVKLKENIPREIKTNSNFTLSNVEINKNYYNNNKSVKTKVKLHLYNTRNEDVNNFLYIKNKILSQVVIGSNIIYRYDITCSPNEIDSIIHIDICGISEINIDIDNNLYDSSYNLYDGQIFKHKKTTYNVPSSLVEENIIMYIKYIIEKFDIKSKDIDLGILNSCKNIVDKIKLL